MRQLYRGYFLGRGDLFQHRKEYRNNAKSLFSSATYNKASVKLQFTIGTSYKCIYLVLQSRQFHDVLRIKPGNFTILHRSLNLFKHSVIASGYMENNFLNSFESQFTLYTHNCSEHLSCQYLLKKPYPFSLTIQIQSGKP